MYLGGLESETSPLQSPWQYARAPPQLAGDFAETGPQQRLGDAQQGGPSERAGQGRGELGVRHRLRRCQAYRALDLIVIEQEPGGAHLIGQRDPAEVLAASPEPGSQPNPEQR